MYMNSVGCYVGREISREWCGIGGMHRLRVFVFVCVYVEGRSGVVIPLPH